MKTVKNEIKKTNEQLDLPLGSQFPRRFHVLDRGPKWVLAVKQSFNRRT
jgi:hypothetical protein